MAPQQILDPGGDGRAAAPRGSMQVDVKPVGCNQQRHVGFANRDIAREHVTVKLQRRIEFADPDHARPDVWADFRLRCVAISVGIHNFAPYRRIHLFVSGRAVFWCLDSEPPPLPRNNLARKPPHGLVVTLILAAVRPPPREDSCGRRTVRRLAPVITATRRISVTSVSGRATTRSNIFGVGSNWSRPALPKR